ncbi:MAG: MBL fold metallo-hydrolase [Hungatella sp.]|jgi:DNA internalization-related competence protein ComEC/Rec2|nr:MBL fold metallo-hydrolase [Hungatella sp.]
MAEKKIRKFYKRVLAAAAVLLVLCMAGCSPAESSSPLTQGQLGNEAGTDLKVHFIDVGQGDSTLVEKDGHYMLIDAGERDQGETVASYLEKQGVNKLDYVIGTHPHSDHIGGLETVIRKFDVQKVFLPEKEHTTKVYERLLDAIADKNLKITVPKPGDTYTLGDAVFQIIAPNRDYGDDLNNWSIGLRLVYGNNSFVLCGDAEKDAEKDMVANGFPLKADVLKLSHHGSSTSSSEGFMDQVDPEYGVISCGKNNDYGHPHKEVLNMLKKRNIKAMRTDQLGTIVAVSDGSKVTFPEIKEGTGGDRTQNTAADQDYVINTNTKKFHLPDCKSAASMKEENRKTYKGSREELIQMGYEPCQSCNP